MYDFISERQDFIAENQDLILENLIALNQNLISDDQLAETGKFLYTFWRLWDRCVI